MKHIKMLLHKGLLTKQQAITAAQYNRDPNHMDLCPSMHRLLHEIIKQEKPLETLENERGWAARSAKTVLGFTLDCMTERYGTSPFKEPTVDQTDAKAMLEYLRDTVNEEAVELQNRFKLSPSEADLLAVLFRNKGRTLSKEHCVRVMRPDRSPDETPEPKIIDVYVCKIRKKIKASNLEIITDWGRGYRLEDQQRIAAE